MKKKTDNENVGVNVIRIIVFSMILSIVGLALFMSNKISYMHSLSPIVYDLEREASAAVLALIYVLWVMLYLLSVVLPKRKCIRRVLFIIFSTSFGIIYLLFFFYSSISNTEIIEDPFWGSAKRASWGEIKKVEVYDAYKDAKSNRLGFKFVFYTNANEKIEVKCIEDNWSEEQRKMKEIEERIKREGISITYNPIFKIKDQFQMFLEKHYNKREVEQIREFLQERNMQVKWFDERD
ncbi:hypothetical protein CON65_01055 [Bacillus pseudomycoides]|uniref:Uncharacterized protein n=1 Tax=Bacillus pseudomycoides TaxID=64104 RepID=A0AA91ZUV8_9BACI|nr:MULTISPECIES: hypothetical protein [Bacillus]PEB54101.1 hypothetical protein COO03_06130 [Bacillus sp. AFS098217]PED84401.1 hypothetical protein CON65_01055 [Bacillus pseudomycoides]PEU13255.1 hypothetical protein CN524_11830 [Bacillus sp. AFS019443]PEU13699.1 hypothetical protein CN525_18885 [Bacillus sp. AFS014408]PFW65476.1 hypothetical protein COL20_00340 [Bacillus sp. AFS075034]